MGFSITEALLAALLFALPPSSNAWAGKPCPDIVQDVRSLLDSYANPEKVRSLRAEEYHAWNDYIHEMKSLRETEDLYGIATHVHGAHQAQLEYCEAHNTLVKLGFGDYEIVPLDRRYYGEDVSKSLSHKASYMNKSAVRYLNEVETESLRVRQKNGMLVLPNGNPLNGLQKAAYVMDSAGGIFILDNRDPRFSPQRGRLNHSSLLRGEPVAAAGEITFDEQGRIIEIDRKSGHYYPGRKQLEQFLSQLQKLGVDLSHAKDVDNYPH